MKVRELKKILEVCDDDDEIITLNRDADCILEDVSFFPNVLVNTNYTNYAETQEEADEYKGSETYTIKALLVRVSY